MSSVPKEDDDAAKYERIKDERDPRRCQALMGGYNSGQCTLVRAELSDYCVLHGGHYAAIRQRTFEKRIYKLNKYRARVEELADNPSSKFLGEELGILRIMVEEILNKCNGEFDLILYSKQIGELISKIQAIVLAMSQLETRAGLTLNKQQALTIAQRVIQAISKVITDPILLEQIAEEISKIFMENEKMNPRSAFEDRRQLESDIILEG